MPSPLAPSVPSSVVALQEAPDRLVVARAADGDLRAFRVLVERHTPAMRAYARRLVGRSADADDVVQESFIAAWKHVDDVLDGTAFQGWMFRIVSRKSFDLLRARRDHDDLTDVDTETAPHAGPEALAQTGSFATGLREALAQLPPQQSQAWFLREVAEYSYQEIADDLGVPVSTVRGLLARARATLMTTMGAWR